MPFNGSGGFDPLSPPIYPAVAGEIIYASRFNAVVDDILSGLGQTVTRNGQSPASANLPMGGFKHTGVGDATAVGQYLAWGQTAAAQLGGALTVAGAAVLQDNLTVNGVSVLKGNVTLLDTITNTLTVAGNVLRSAAGNWSFAAPTSGIGMSIASVTGNRSLQAGVLGSTNNPRLEVWHTEASGLTELSFSGSTTTVAGRLAVSGTPMMDFTFNRNITIQAPASGDTFKVLGVADAYVGDFDGVNGGGRKVRMPYRLAAGAAGATGTTYPLLGYNVDPRADGTIKYQANDTASYLQFQDGGFDFYGGATVGTGGNNLTVTKLFHVKKGGGVFGNSLHNNATLPTGTTDQPPGMSGTSTPTITSITNLTGTPTSIVEKWVRNGNLVTVTGSLGGCVATANNNSCTVQVTVPLGVMAGITIAAAGLVGGGWENNGKAGSMGIVNNTTVQFSWFNDIAGSHPVQYQYSYIIG